MITTAKFRRDLCIVIYKHNMKIDYNLHINYSTLALGTLEVYKKPHINDRRDVREPSRSPFQAKIFCTLHKI